MGVNGTNMTQEQWDSNVASIRKGMQTATPTTGIPAGVDPAYHASVVQSYNDSLLRRPADQASANTAIAQEKSANPAAWGIPPTITAKPPTQMSSTNNMPTAQPMSAQQAVPPDYAALASARFAASLAQKRTIAQQQKTSADTAYQQQNLRTKDDRILGDFSRTQVANPFSNLGRKSFQEGLIGRERTQADADASAALVAQKGNIDSLLASYENATADEQVRIADELQRADRDYQLNLSQLSGQMPGGGQTLAARSQDQNYGLNLAGLSGQLPGSLGGGQTMQAKSLAFDQGMQNRQMNNQEQNTSFNQNLQTKQFDYQKAQDEWKNTFAKEQYSDQKAQQIWENTFKDKSFQQSVSQAAQQLGVDYARLNQSQQQFVADQAFKEKSLQLQQDQFDYSSDPNNPDNLYKGAEINWKNADAAKMIADSNKGTSGIDEYDLLQVNGLAEQAGISANTKPNELKTFVAGLKGKYGWDLAEAQKVESYLNAQQKAAKDKADASKAAEKPKPFGYRSFGG